MKLKISELTDLALDWAVGAARGLSWKLHDRVPYSSNWAYGGVILDENKTEFDFNEDLQRYFAYDGISCGVGKTHLIAACRCFLITFHASPEIEVPDGILALA